MSVSMTGKDTIVIDNRVLTDLPDGDVVNLKFPQPVAAVKTGKNGNSLYAYNASGQQAEVEIRIIRGSADDKYLANRLAQQNLNFAGFVLIQGQFIKKIGDGLGNITSDTYVCGGGIFENNVDAKSNVEGNTDQSIALYKIKFANAPRAIT